MSRFDYLSKKAAEINVLMSLPGDKTAFVFFTDVHWGANEKRLPLMLDFLLQNTDLKNVFFGGDAITCREEDKEAVFEIWREFKACFAFAENFFCLLGNHDNNSYEQENPAAILTKKETSSLLHTGGGISISPLNPNERFYDDVKDKTRYLLLDTSQRERGTSRLIFVKEALKTSPAGWHIVVMAHILLEWNGASYTPNDETGPLFELFAAYNSREGEFLEAEAKISLLMGGHVHNDFVTFDYAGGIPLVLSDSDAMFKSCNRRNPPILKTPAEQCATVVVINHHLEEQHFIRIGRGSDFSLKYSRKGAEIMEKSNMEGYLVRSKKYKKFHYTALTSDMTAYLHRRLLEMLKQAKEILESNHIPYYICGGTLLGAKMRRGFFPWDDDVDICVPADCYESMTECLLNNIPGGVSFQCNKTEPNYYHGWGKLRDSFSKVYPNEPIYKENGVWIDFYKMLPLRENEVEYAKIKEHLDYLDRRSRASGISEYEKTRRIQENKLSEKLEAAKIKAEGEKGKEVYFIQSASGVVIDRSWCDPPRTFVFEGLELPGFFDTEKYLTAHYGKDYDKLPPEDLRSLSINRVERLD